MITKEYKNGKWIVKYDEIAEEFETEQESDNRIIELNQP
jgi:hypothetical protein